MLPFSYALRNLWRRRMRTLVTLGGIALITTLIVLMGGFASGLSGTVSSSASSDVMLLVGSSGEHDMVRSVINGAMRKRQPPESRPLFARTGRGRFPSSCTSPHERETASDCCAA